MTWIILAIIVFFVVVIALAERLDEKVEDRIFIDKYRSPRKPRNKIKYAQSGYRAKKKRNRVG